MAAGEKAVDVRLGVPVFCRRGASSRGWQGLCRDLFEYQIEFEAEFYKIVDDDDDEPVREWMTAQIDNPESSSQRKQSDKQTRGCLSD